MHLFKLRWHVAGWLQLNPARACFKCALSQPQDQARKAATGRQGHGDPDDPRVASKRRASTMKAVLAAVENTQTRTPMEGLTLSESPCLNGEPQVGDFEEMADGQPGDSRRVGGNSVALEDGHGPPATFRFAANSGEIC